MNLSFNNNQFDLRIQDSLTRADLWLLVSQGFYIPCAENYRKFLAVGNELQSELENLRHPMSGLITQWIESYRATKRKDLEYEYHALFTTDVLVNPYEGGYQRHERGSIIGDISGFYKAFGVIPEEQSGPPDSLWNECAFMSWMSLKESYATEQNLSEEYEITRTAAATFMQDHLGRWVGEFCHRLVGTSGNPVFVIGTDVLLQLSGLTLDEFGVKEVHPFEFERNNEEISNMVECPAVGLEKNSFV